MSKTWSIGCQPEYSLRSITILAREFRATVGDWLNRHRDQVITWLGCGRINHNHLWLFVGNLIPAPHPPTHPRNRQLASYFVWPFQRIYEIYDPVYAWSKMFMEVFSYVSSNFWKQKFPKQNVIYTQLCHYGMHYHEAGYLYGLSYPEIVTQCINMRCKWLLWCLMLFLKLFWI